MKRQEPTEVNRPMKTRRYPVLLARPVKRRDWSGDMITVWHAWCPFCRMFHQHVPEKGYRVAHCGSNGEGFGAFGGYILKLDPAYRALRARRKDRKPSTDEDRAEARQVADSLNEVKKAQGGAR